MNIGGWIMLLVSWAVIILLVVFCYRRIFTTPHPHLKAPLEIDTEED
jgi:hypothetical protein